MQKFNSTDLFTGYLKQLLNDFNLPKLKVYTEEHRKYFKKHGVEREDILETIVQQDNSTPKGTKKNKYIWPSNLRYVQYIKDGRIQEYINGKWTPIGTRVHVKNKHSHYYNYGDKILNYTKNLKITNNIYDSYTHEYLGDYLRFQRDYLNINLMPLYNCFSNRTCEKLKLSGYYIAYNEVTEDGNEFLNTKEFSFDSSNSQYKIYMLPVKLFQEYTIAIDCTSPFEICCGMYGAYQDKRQKFASLPSLTYQKISHSLFSKPFLYEGLKNINKFTLGDSLIELSQNEGDLKLFIKLPANNDSSIVVLEGNYTNWSDTSYSRLNTVEIPIIAYGEGDPSSNGETPSADYEGKTYLDTKNAVLYECKAMIDEVTNINTYVWVCRPIWKDYTIESFNDRFEHIVRPNQTLIIDLAYKYYEENGFDVYEVDEYGTPYYKSAIPWAQTYILNNPIQKIAARRSAYFNPTCIDIYNKGGQYKLVINLQPVYEKEYNKSVINLDQIDPDANFKLITSLQLLRINTKEHHPFADRLIEYLLENAITDSPEEIADNVKRVQKVVAMNSSCNQYQPIIPGYWDPALNKIIYEYITNKNTTFETNHDILGYIDKDAENSYKNVRDYYSNDGKLSKRVITSLLNVELEEDE